MVHSSLFTDVTATGTNSSGLDSGYQGLSNCKTSRYLTVYLTGICITILLNENNKLSKGTHNSSNYAHTSSLVVFYCSVLPTNSVFIRRSYFPAKVNYFIDDIVRCIFVKNVHRLKLHLSLFLRIQLIMNQH